MISMIKSYSDIIIDTIVYIINQQVLHSLVSNLNGTHRLT